MIKMKFHLGQTVLYNGNRHKIRAIRFTSGGVMYQLSFSHKWVYEIELAPAYLK